MDCKIKPYITFMVIDPVWLQVFDKYNAGDICPTCFETRLGRKLKLEDLADAPMSWWLIEKLTKETNMKFRIQLIIQADELMLDKIKLFEKHAHYATNGRYSNDSLQFACIWKSVDAYFVQTFMALLVGPAPAEHILFLSINMEGPILDEQDDPFNQGYAMSCVGRRL